MVWVMKLVPQTQFSSINRKDYIDMKKILDYFGLDGLLHIICCMVIMQLSGNFLPLWVAVLITAAIGLGKEFIWDKWLKKGTFEKRDLLADAVGIILGLI